MLILMSILFFEVFNLIDQWIVKKKQNNEIKKIMEFGLELTPASSVQGLAEFRQTQ